MRIPFHGSGYDCLLKDGRDPISAVARLSAAAIGVALAGFCVLMLGGGGGVFARVAAVYNVVMLGCEYLIRRDHRSLASD
jgi:hypothetical protein